MKENKLKNLNLLAILQGRLVNSERRNYIQYFPSKNWIKEFHLARNMKIKFIEWVANYENIKFNTIFLTSKTIPSISASNRDILSTLLFELLKVMLFFNFSFNRSGGKNIL